MAAKLIGDPPARGSIQKIQPEEYRALLHRSKMALSVRGGGFDTVRYWEIPASGALLISERPDIVIPHNFEHGVHAIFCRPDLQDLPGWVRQLRDDEPERTTDGGGGPPTPAGLPHVGTPGDIFARSLPTVAMRMFR